MGNDVRDAVRLRRCEVIVDEFELLTGILGVRHVRMVGPVVEVRIEAQEVVRHAFQHRPVFVVARLEQLQ